MLIFPDLATARTALMGQPELVPHTYRTASGELNGIVRRGAYLYYSLTSTVDPWELIRHLTQS